MTFRVDLTNCDREPIHIPGSIQPHGAMLVCEDAPLVVRWASKNAAAVLGLGEGEPAGQLLDDLVGAEAGHQLNNTAAKSMSPEAPGLLFGLTLPGADQRFDVAAHTYKGRTFLEFQTAAAEDDRYGPLELTRALVRRLAGEPTMERLARSAARMVRLVLGYDRVMIYQLLHNGAGRVIAEDRDPELGSFLGLHFPASDIPAQARDLYLRNWIRMISEVNYAPIPLQPPVKAFEKPIDMSYAQLRSVSPVHCEYLRNMGVSASMSVSLISGGRLWGLIACHHYSPKVVPLPYRVAAELFGQFTSRQIEAIERREQFEATETARQRLDRIVAMLAPEQELSQSLRQRLPDLAELIACDGAALLLDGTCIRIGQSPAEGAVRALAGLLNEHGRGDIWTTSELESVLPGQGAQADAVAGAMAIPISHKRRDYLFFFRSEESRHVDWAGDPEKPASVGPLGDRLTPRQSFELWRQEVKGQSTPWTAADRAIADAVQNYLRDVVLLHTEATADERRRADARRKLVNQELNHRVKNILALTRSIVLQSRAGVSTVEEYADAVSGRLTALSFAHDHVTRDKQGGDLRLLLDSEFAAYGGEGRAGRIRISGPDVRFDSRAFSAFALAVHELTTNAAKYGALMSESGMLEVDWRLEPSGDLALSWRESGVRMSGPPARKGFGTRLITAVIPYDLGGSAELTYGPDGLNAEFRIPARFVAPAEAEDQPAAAPAGAQAEDEEAAPAQVDLSGRTVLLVEDQMLIAMDAENALRALGAADVQVAPTAQKALRRIALERPDLGVLDVNLGETTSADVAETLKELGVPFIFASGYQEIGMLPASLKSAPLVRKPYSQEDLAAGIAQALAAARAPSGFQPKA